MYDPQTGGCCGGIARAKRPSPASWTTTPFLAHALLDLYEAEFDLRYIEAAGRMAE